MDPALVAECESIRDMLVANIHAIRTNASGGTTTIQTIAKRIYTVTLRPKVFGFLFDLIKKAIEDDMYQNFTLPIISGKINQPNPSAAQELKMNSDDYQQGENRIFNTNTRSIFAFVVEFNRSFVSVAKSIKFSVQYLDATYGIRCRNYTLADYPYRVIEKSFREIRESLYETLFAFINDVRGGRDADLAEIRSVVRFVMEISNKNSTAEQRSTLMEEFLQRNLDEAQKYYRVAGADKQSRISQEGGTQNYAQWALEHIESEKTLMRNFLDAGNRTIDNSLKHKTDTDYFRSVWKPVREVLYETVVKSLIVDSELVSKEVTGGRNISDLYTLLSTIAPEADEAEGLRRLAHAFEGFASSSSMSILSMTAPTPQVAATEESTATAKKSAAPQQISEEAAKQQQIQHNFPKLVDFVDRFVHDVWAKQLKSNPVVLQGFRKGLNATIKEFSEIPKIFSDTVDNFIKKCNEDDVAENQAKLLTFLVIFESISQKDEFLPNYKSRLAARLIRPGTFKHALETQFIRDMKKIVGNADTHPLSSMIVDVENSRTLTNTFIEAVWKGYTDEVATQAAGLGSANAQQTQLFNGGKPLKASFILATAQYWPTMDRISMKHNPSINLLIQKFTSYYTSRHNNRKISWSLSNSTASIQTLFASGPKEVSGTLIQASLMLQIDDATFSAVCSGGRSATADQSKRFGLSPKQLADLTELPLDIIRDTLASMTFDPRFNVLSHFHPETGAPLAQKVIKDEFPHFAINLNYKSATKKFELPKPRSAKANNSDQQRHIEDLRKLNAQISVIRYMKSRGTSAYQDMVTAVLSDLRIRFDAQPALVKQTLDVLIEKEYIRRADEDFNQLVYIA